MTSTSLDLLFLGIISGYTYVAYRRGLVLQLLHITSFFVSFIVAYQFSPQLIPWLRQHLPLPIEAAKLEYLPVLLKLVDAEQIIYHGLAFAILFFGMRIGLALGAHLLDGVMHLPILKMANHWLGAVLGCFEISLLFWLIVNLLAVLPAEWAQGILHQSQVAQWVLQQTSLFF